MKRVVFPLILILLILSLPLNAKAGSLAAPPSSTPTPSNSVITWGQAVPLRAPVRVALNMDTVWALAVDPQSPGTIYVGTSVGVCKSEDKGGTWRTMNAGLPSSAVPALAVDPRATNTLYASSWRRGVFKSTDGGVTWRAVSEGLTNLDVQALALDPGAPDTVYAGVYGGGVFKSTDGGATWQAYNEGLAADTKVLALAVDPHAQGTIYIGTSEKGVFKSTDGGVTWPAASEGLTSRDVWTLAVDPQASDTVYAGTSGGVFKSTDGGAKWQEFNEGLTNLYVRALALDAGVPGIVYAGTREGGVFKSTDGGATWRAIGKGLTTTVARLAVAPQMPGTIYVGTQGEGVFRSTDGGDTWRALTESWIATNVAVLAVDPHASDTVYAGTSGGVFKSTDGGITWQVTSEGLTSRDVRALAVDHQAVGTVYVGTSGGVFKSSDGGVTWQAVNEGLTGRDVRALAVDPQTSGTVYVGIRRGGVFKSVDGAATWQEVNKGLINLDVWTLVLNPLSPTTVYVGTLGGGVFKSVDGAATWRMVNEGLTNLQVWALALDPQSPDTVYASTEDALFKSVDGGLGWQRLFSGQFTSLSFDPLISQVLYAATGTSVNLSRDGGVSWEEVGLHDTPIRLLVINTDDAQTIYGAAGETGIFRGEVNRKLLPSGNNWLLPLISFSLVPLLFLAWIYKFIAQPNQMPVATALRLLPAPRQLVLAIGGGYVERRFFQKWEKAAASMNASQEQFANLVTDLTDQFCERLQLRKTLESPMSYKKITGLVLDVTPVVEDTGLSPRLPLLFLRRAVLQEGDLEDLRYLLKERLEINIAFLVIFAGNQLVQEAQKMAEVLRSAYACDVIAVGNVELRQLVLAPDPPRALRSLLVRNVNLATFVPFVIEGPTPVTMFFGRELEMQDIAENAKSVSYAVISGRRFGKTSILKCLHHVRLPAKGFRTFYHDCAITPTYDAFLGATTCDWQPESLPDIPITLGELLQSSPTGKPLVLLLDEADELVLIDCSSGWPLFKVLRSLANSGRAQVVLSGERTLRDALRDPTSPLFNFAKEMFLGPLDFHAVEKLVTQPVKKFEIELVDEAAMVRRIYDFTSGHPNVVQRLCHRLTERLNEQGTRRITLDDVDAVIENPDFIRKDFLETYFSRASTLEHLCTLLMAADINLRTLTAVHKALANNGVIATLNQVDAALERLVDLRRILKRTSEGYDFAVMAFPLIILKSKQLSDWIALRREIFVHAGDIAPEIAPPELKGRLWR